MRNMGIISNQDTYLFFFHFLKFSSFHSFLPSVTEDITHISDSDNTGHQASSQDDHGITELTEYTLFQISEEITTDKVDDVGYILGFNTTQITRFKETNDRGPTVTSEGTYTMLHDWYEMTSIKEAVPTLSKALIEAGLAELDERFLREH